MLLISHIFLTVSADFVVLLAALIFQKDCQFVQLLIYFLFEFFLILFLFAFLPFFLFATSSLPPSIFYFPLDFCFIASLFLTPPLPSSFDHPKEVN